MDSFFYIDLCSFMILLSLLISICTRKMVRNNTNRLYIFTMTISTFSVFIRLLFKICSFFAPKTTFFYIVLYVLKYFELTSYCLIFPVGLFFILSITGIYYRFRNNTVLSILIFILLLIPVLLVISNIFIPWIFVITEDFVYLTSKYFIEIKIDFFVIAMICYILSTTIQRPELLINPVVNARSYYSFLDVIKKYYSAKRSGSVIFVKIINHKNIQMYIGHEEYLKFLRYLSNLLVNISIENKMEMNVYYLEGCAFALPTESKNIKNIRKIAEDISDNLKNEFKLDDFSILMEPRVCLVRIPNDIDNYEYLKNFSKAFHHMLPENSNAIWLGDINKTREFKIKNELETIIDFAISNNLFKIFYQPIYDVVQKRYVSAEALVRLEDENYGFINPEIFIPAAEANGSIHRIGNCVIDKVCKFIGEGAFNFLGLEYIEINLSLSQCIESHFVDNLIESLHKYNVSPECIRLEVTESPTELNQSLVEESIKRLHSYGIKFVLDDYGVGYSNFHDLLYLPFDVIKLDKSFVNEIDNPQMRSVIKDTIRMMIQLKKIVFVEGIEKEENIKLFSNLGCTSIQGYYFSKPLPESEFVEFMRKNR